MTLTLTLSLVCGSESLTMELEASGSHECAVSSGVVLILQLC